MSEQRKVRCPECGEDVAVTRRDFVKQAGAAAAAISAGAVPLFATPRVARADETKPNLSPETAVKRLYESLKDEQRKVICKPFEDPLQKKYNANWAITKPTIEEFFTKDQQELIREIFRGCTSGEGYERFMKQMKEDAGGFGHYHVAIVGKPDEKDKFQSVMTGRHVTIRDDGNFEDGTAFGGPMVYGHGTGDSQKGLPGNVFYYQTQKANEVFRCLDGKQRKAALLTKAPRENDVPIQGTSGKFPGLTVGELSSDQKALVEEVIKVI